MKSNTLALKDILFEECKENITECEAAIPDYYPEVFRIVRTQSQPLIQKTAQSGDKTVVQGVVIHSVLYVPEDGKGLCSFTQKCPFTCAYESDAEGLFIASAKAQYVSCKLSTPRKAVIKAVLGVKLTVLGKREIPLFKPEQPGILSKLFEAEVSCPVTQGQKLFKINGEQEIKDNVGAPLYTTAIPFIKEVRVINGKTIVKGEMQIKTLYVTHSDEVKEFIFTTGFSQITDTPDSCEGDLAQVFVNICDTDARLCAAESENASAIEYDITAQVQALICRKTNTQLATDCFCVNYETEMQRQTARFTHICGAIEGSTRVQSKLSFADGILRAVDACSTVRVDTCAHENRILRIAGSIETRIIYINGENELQSTERAIPFDAEYATEDIKNLTCRPEGYVTGCSIIPSGESEAQISLTLFAFGYLEKQINCEYISKVNILTDRPKATDSLPALSLYFAKKGEAVWEIAKSYNISPERIKALNSCEDILSEDKRLLLPRLCI